MQEFTKVPTPKQSIAAVGTLPGLKFRLKKSLQAVIPHFKFMEKPKKGDWLWQHQQDGQTFNVYSKQMKNVVDLKRNIIYIKPLQFMDKQFLEKLKYYCQCFFVMRVKILKATKLDVSSRINEYTGRKQLHARQILKKINPPSDAFCVLGICMTDLYPKDEWNFVFGLASIRQRTGVFSFARYSEQFYEEGEYQIDYSKVLWRSIGVMVHEITHMFGIRHCIFYECVMNGSNSLEQSCRRPMELCPVCLHKLQSNIGFDVLERYDRILKFLNQIPNHNLQNLVYPIAKEIRIALKEQKQPQIKSIKIVVNKKVGSKIISVVDKIQSFSQQLEKETYPH